MSTIAERVAAGAAFLDEREPGWDLRINLDRLYVGDCSQCVLGQLCGTYPGGVIQLHLAVADCEGLGFMWVCEEGHDPEAESADIEALTTEWKQLIAGRRPDAWSRTITATFDHSGNRARNIGAP